MCARSWASRAGSGCVHLLGSLPPFGLHRTWPEAKDTGSAELELVVPFYECRSISDCEGLTPCLG